MYNNLLYEVNIFEKPEQMCILEVETERLKEAVHIPPFLMQHCPHGPQSGEQQKEFYEKIFARQDSADGDLSLCSSNANADSITIDTNRNNAADHHKTVSKDTARIFKEVTRDPTYNSYMIAKRL